MRSHPALNHFRRHVLCSALLVAAGICGAIPNAHAQDAANKKSFDVPEQPAAKALNSFAEQADITLVFSQDLVQGMTVHPLHGTYTTLDGLRAMLEGTGLSIQKVNEHTISIGERARTEEASPVESRRKGVNTLAAVTVTGTRIRGGSSPSPVITIGSEQIQQEGYTDLGQVIRSLPQNFSGGQNPGDLAGGSNGGGGNYDVTGGSGLNLRGLGPDASLTLLNGRRLAYDGYSQAVDISAIPVEAIERLEIVPDGASAIYGSDAVGGVANVILKRDFDGVTVGTRYGGATEGGLTTREYAATAGTTWMGGGLIATFKDTTADPVYANQRNYTQYLFDPYTIYPGAESRNGLVSVHQSLGDVAELKLDALRTKRDTPKYQGISTNSYYRLRPEVSIMLVSPSIEFSLPHDWSLTLSGTRGKDNVLGSTTIVSAAGSSLSHTRYNNQSRSWEAGAEGPLFSVGGGDARLAVGAGARKNVFRTNDDRDSESVRFAYVELDAPFVSPDLNIPGIHRLELSAAIRSEDYYTSFGRVTTPKLGLVYDPTADLTFRTSWGKSFKAPTLEQRSEAKATYLLTTPMAGGIDSPTGATALMSYGGSVDLGAERAKTWTASLALHPEALPGLDAELSWFDINYADRVVRPVIYPQALSNPVFASFVDRSPTPEKIQDLLAVYSIFYNLAGVNYDPDKVVAIIRDEYVNAARQRIKGLDLSSSYRFDLRDGQLMVRGSVSWLDSVQATSAGQPKQTLAGTAYYPARIKGRIGAVWASGGLTASGFVNYTGGVVNTNIATVKEKSASFTTLDATINYDMGKRADALSGLMLGLSVQNLLNRAPPLYTIPSPSFLVYDPTNYSPIGRFVSVSVSKHW